MRWQEIVEDLEAAGMKEAAQRVLALREKTKCKRGPRTKHWARLTPALRAEIHRLHKQVGLTQTQIQDRLNYPQGGISAILKGLQ